MTIAAQPTRVSYTGNGTQANFTVTWRVLDAAQLAVYVDEGLTSDYTVLGIGDPTCTVRFTTAPAAGADIIIILNAPIVQKRVFAPGPIRAVPVEDAADDDAIRDRTLAARLEQSIRVAPYEESGTMWVLPSAEERAFRALAFDAVGRLALAEVEDIIGAADAITWDNGDGLDLDNNDDLIFDGSARTIEAQTVVYQPATAVQNVQTAIERIGLTPQDFGAIGDGVADDTAAIQAAINAVKVTGGEIIFPPGTYRHSGLTMSSGGGVILRGLGLKGNTPNNPALPGVALVCSSATATHLALTNTTRVWIDGIAFSPAQGVTPTAGYGLRVTGGNRFMMTKCRFTGTWNSVSFENIKEVTLRDVDIAYVVGDYCANVVGTSGSPAIVYDWEDVTLYSTIPLGSTTMDGLRIGAYCYTHYFRRLLVNQVKRSIVIGEGCTDAQRPLFLRFDIADLEKSTDSAVDIHKGAWIWFNDAYMAICARGMRVRSTCTGGGNGQIYVNTSMMASNGFDGLLLEACPDVRISNSVICNNSANISGVLDGGPYGPANTYDGIRVTAAKAHLMVTGCRIGGGAAGESDGTGNQRYGITFSAAVQAGYVSIGHNNFSGNTTGGILKDAAAVFTQASIADNINCELDTILNRHIGTGLNRLRVTSGSTSPVIESWPETATSAYLGVRGATGNWLLQREGSTPAVLLNLRMNGTTISGAAPTVNADVAAGYRIGDHWIYNLQEYVCVNDAAGAAVWKQTTV